MAGSIVAVTRNFSSSSSNAPTVARPGTGETGDFYVISYRIRHTLTFNSLPDGFTEVSEWVSESSVGSSLRAAIKAWDGSEPSSFAAQTNGYYPWDAMCSLVRGCASATVVDIASTPAGSPPSGPYAGFVSTVAPTTGPMTAPSDGHFVVWIAASTGASSTDAGTQTPPSGFTTPTDGAYQSFNQNIHHHAYLAGVATGTETYTGSVTFPAGASRSQLCIGLMFQEAGASASIVKQMMAHHGG